MKATFRECYAEGLQSVTPLLTGREPWVAVTDGDATGERP